MRNIDDDIGGDHDNADDGDANCGDDGDDDIDNDRSVGGESGDGGSEVEVLTMIKMSMHMMMTKKATVLMIQDDFFTLWHLLAHFLIHLFLQMSLLAYLFGSVGIVVCPP